MPHSFNSIVGVACLRWLLSTHNNCFSLILSCNFTASKLHVTLYKQSSVVEERVNVTKWLRTKHIYTRVYHSTCPLIRIGTSHPPPASECVPFPWKKGFGGVHTRLRVRGCGSPNSDDWRKNLAHCLHYSVGLRHQDILHATPNELLGNRKRIVNTMGPWVTHRMLTFRLMFCFILILSE